MCQALENVANVEFVKTNSYGYATSGVRSLGTGMKASATIRYCRNGLSAMVLAKGVVSDATAEDIGGKIGGKSAVTDGENNGENNGESKDGGGERSS